MGSWLYIDDARIRLVLSQRRLPKARSRGVFAWMFDRDDPWGGFRGRGGSFGGGGAGGSWDTDAEKLPPLGGVEWIPVIAGDPDCPDSGVKRAWTFWTRWDEWSTPPQVRTYGPHNNGPHTRFIGLVRRDSWNTWGMPYDNWLPIDNASLMGESETQVVFDGQTPGCPPVGNLNTGICVLPTPYPPTTTGDIYAEVWLEPQAEVPGDQHWQQCIGNIWQARNQICEPARRVYVPVEVGANPLDRRRTPNAKTDKVREDGAALPVIPPPFVFGFVPGVAPTRPPAPEPGGFRPRQPPRGRTREPPKKRGAIRTIFRILDILSESAEVVDCFYGTLPKATRRRWEKGRPNRGLLDQAGQYGIDGADWKMQALWHNSPDIDLGKALDCVAANQIEDAIVGRIQANLPKGAGTAIGRNVSRAEYLRERERNDAMWARRRAENAARRRAAA